MGTTTPKPFVFVLMPFSDDFVDVYNLGIKPACDSAGSYCERVDEQFFTGGILQRIYNQIAKADIIISDMTGRNPNVFYETGYAHALGISVILLTQDANDIPFDLMNYPHIIYEGKITFLKEELEKHVRWHIENPSEKLRSDPSGLHFYIHGTKIGGAGGLKITLPLTRLLGPPQIRLAFDIHNSTNTFYDSSHTEIGVILPVELSGAPQQPVVQITKKQCMHLIKEIGNIPPGGWRPIHIQFMISDISKVVDTSFDCALRLFSPVGFTDIPFQLSIDVDEPENLDEIPF